MKNQSTSTTKIVASANEIMPNASVDLGEIPEALRVTPNASVDLGEIPEALRDAILPGTSAEVIRRYAQFVQIARDADFGPFDNNLVVLDTETTGLSHDHDELTQIAAARVENGRVVDWYVTFVNPGKPIPEDIVHLTGISDELVENAPTPEEAIAGLVDFVGDAIIVAHSAGFDREFITTENCSSKKHPAGYPLIENTWIDSLDLARIVLPRFKGHRLKDLSYAFETAASTHRADDDVTATAAVLRYLLAGITTMPVELIEAIAHLAPAEDWPTGTVFTYFAERARGASTSIEVTAGPTEDTEDSAQTETALFKEEGKRVSRRTLNLKSLRRARLNELPQNVKFDAFEILATEAYREALPTADEIRKDFQSDGLVGRIYDQYETRSEQADMAAAVCDAFCEGKNLVVEAGTGVGKSMAYLDVAAKVAMQGKVTVGIATKTNALLDQLMYHELPALSAALKVEKGRDLAYVSLKGYTHYPCLWRVNRLLNDGLKPRQVGKETLQPAPSFAALLSFIEQTGYDDIDALKINYGALPRATVTVQSHDCMKHKCPFYQCCFVHGARRAAEKADIVVTNHSLLFANYAADGGLLPPIRHWVVDEAHGAEAEIRRAFSQELSAEELIRLAHNLEAAESKRNPFYRSLQVVGKLANEEDQTLFYSINHNAVRAGAEFAAAARVMSEHMKDLLYYKPYQETRSVKDRSKGYETIELWLNDDIRRCTTWEELEGYGVELTQKADALIHVSQQAIDYLDKIDGAADIEQEIASLCFELQEIIESATVVFSAVPPKCVDGAGAYDAFDNYAFSATLNKKKDKNTEKLEALLLNVGTLLQERFYPEVLSVVYASATLSTNHTFEAFNRAVGLNQGQACCANELMLASSFDFDNNMIIYVPTDIPEPTEAGYKAALDDLLLRAHTAMRGSLLTLFTNRKDMEESFSNIREELQKENLRLVCQKWGVSTKSLREDFIKDHSLSLFALKSFWEGFDAPGDTLRGVIIPKLPFNKPTDPLSCERALRDDKAWMNYVLPQAIIETKQAVGRLIRTSTDSGIVILADKRLLTKFYGKIVLASMPSATIKQRTTDEIIEALTEMAKTGF